MTKLFFKASGRLRYLGSERDALTSGVWPSPGEGRRQGVVYNKISIAKLHKICNNGKIIFTLSQKDL